jgi:hypothetical protein
MAIELVPIPLPAPADASKLANFGREVKGIDPATITPGSESLKEIESALYTVGLENKDLPWQNFCVLINFCVTWIAAWCASVSKYQIDACPAVCDHKGLCYLILYSRIFDAWQVFDPQCEDYGHGNNKIDESRKSILHKLLQAIPPVPQVQLIGNGTVYNHEGFSEVRLKHPSHATFHKTHVSPEDEAKGITRFYRWHFDAALYDLNPPRVTTLYAVNVPHGPKQICRYDDGTGDVLEAPLGTTAFVSGKVIFLEC